MKKIGKCPFWAKKPANALFGQKNQHPAFFLKLIREMPLFCNSIIRKLKFMKNSIIGLSSYIQPFATLASQTWTFPIKKWSLIIA